MPRLLTHACTRPAAGVDQAHLSLSSAQEHTSKDLKQLPAAVGYIALSTEGLPSDILQSAMLQPLAALAAIAAHMSSDHATSFWLAYQASQAVLAAQLQKLQAGLQDASAAAIAAARSKAEADMAATKAAASIMLKSLRQQTQDLAAQLQAANQEITKLQQVYQQELTAAEAREEALQQAAVAAQQVAAAASAGQAASEKQVQLLEAALAAEKAKAAEELAAMKQVAQELLKASRFASSDYGQQSGPSPYAIAAVAAPRREAPPRQTLPVVAPPASVANSSSGAAVRVKEYIYVKGEETEVMTGPRGGKYYITMSRSKRYLTLDKRANIFRRQVSGY